MPIPTFPSFNSHLAEVNWMTPVLLSMTFGFVWVISMKERFAYLSLQMALQSLEIRLDTDFVFRLLLIANFFTDFMSNQQSNLPLTHHLHTNQILTVNANGFFALCFG